jgi:hypothetical protein
MGRKIDWEKRQEWEERLARREFSELTVAEFCEWEGVSVAAFYQWRKKLSGRPAGRRSSVQGALPGHHDAGSRGMPLPNRNAFLPVHLTGSETIKDALAPARLALARPQTACSQLEIQLPGGVRIFVPMSDAGTLREVLIAASGISSELGESRC